MKYLEELNIWYHTIHTDKDWANIPIITKIEENLRLTFIPEPFGSDLDSDSNVCMANSPEVRDDYKDTFRPIELLDYIYAVLHSSSYREKYKELLKIDFLHVQYPTDPKIFWQLVRLGDELRQLHLLESHKDEDYSTTYPVVGDNKVVRKLTISSPGFELTDSTDPERSGRGKVWINDTQYFDNIPLTAWKFYISGYQPAQKWIKDLRGCTLNFEDILQYKKIIVALTETQRLMEEIDAIEIE